MGRNRYRIVDSRRPHFLTCTVLHWFPVFTRQEAVEILLDSLRYLQREGLKVYAYVVLENHLHLVCQSAKLPTDIARFKSYTARKLIGYLTRNNSREILEQLAYYKKAHKRDRKFQFWQEGYHAKLISNESVLRQKVDYIHHNPVRRGYVDIAEH